MAVRNVYYVNSKGNWATAHQNFQWPKKLPTEKWWQNKKRTAPKLQSAFQKQHPNTNYLEVSSASNNPLGKKLSAFNLKVHLGKLGLVPLETVYQSSKSFYNPDSGKLNNLNALLYKHIAYDKKDSKFKWVSGQAKPKQAKFAAGIYKEHEQLHGFRFRGDNFGLDPKGAIYNYIYDVALAQSQNRAVANQVINYNAFADIQAKPGKTFNTQAQACTVFNALVKTGQLGNALRNYSNFVKITQGLNLDNTAQKQASAPSKPASPVINNDNKVIKHQAPKSPVKPSTTPKPKGKKHYVSMRERAKGKPSILDTKADAILDPVNTYGVVMRNSAADQLKSRHYRMFQCYRFYCYAKHDQNPKTGKFYTAPHIKVNGQWKDVYHGRGHGKLHTNTIYPYKIKKTNQLIIMTPTKGSYKMGRHFNKTSNRAIIRKNQALNKKDQLIESDIFKHNMKSIADLYKGKIHTLAIPEFNRNTGGLNWRTSAKPIIENTLKGTGIKPIYYNPYAKSKAKLAEEQAPKASSKTSVITQNPFTESSSAAKAPKQSAAPSSASKSPSASSKTASSASSATAKKAKPAKKYLPDHPLSDDQKSAFNKRLGKAAPAFIQGIGNANTLFGKNTKVAIYGSHTTKAFTAPQQNNIRRVVKAMGQKGFIPVTGLNTGSDTIAAKQALKDGKPQIGVVASNLQYVSPSSNINLVKKLGKSNSYVLSPHRNNDYVSFKKASTYRNRDKIINGISDAIILSSVKTKDGKLDYSDPGFHYAKFMHDDQHKNVYYLQGNMNQDVQKELHGELGAVPVSTLLPNLNKTQVKETTPDQNLQDGATPENDPSTKAENEALGSEAAKYGATSGPKATPQDMKRMKAYIYSVLHSNHPASSESTTVSSSSSKVEKSSQHINDTFKNVTNSNNSGTKSAESNTSKSNNKSTDPNALRKLRSGQPSKSTEVNNPNETPGFSQQQMEQMAQDEIAAKDQQDDGLGDPGDM